MMPISGRIPEDLYQWLSTTSFEGATTLSDKLRVGLATLKRLQEGDTDYNGALERQQDLCKHLRKQLSTLELEHGHSEVLAILLEHAPAITATLASAQLDNLAEAKRLEAQVVRRSVELTESLLRQAITAQARAYDPEVVNKYLPAVIELAAIIQQHKTNIDKGN